MTASASSRRSAPTIDSMACGRRSLRPEQQGVEPFGVVVLVEPGRRIGRPCAPARRRRTARSRHQCLIRVWASGRRPLACRALARAIAPSAVAGGAPSNQAMTWSGGALAVSIAFSARTSRAEARGQPARSRRAASSSRNDMRSPSWSASAQRMIFCASGSEIWARAASAPLRSPDATARRPSCSACMSAADTLAVA